MDINKILPLFDRKTISVYLCKPCHRTLDLLNLRAIFLLSLQVGITLIVTANREIT